MSEKEFVDGLFIKPPHERAPDFVKCVISIKRKELGNWLRGKDSEWINLQVKESKGGGWYAEIDTWKPNSGGNSVAAKPTEDDGFSDDIPF